MVVYIEYAFLENFLYDGVLLCLSLAFSRVRIGWWRVALSAALGAAFALVYPLLRLPAFCGQLLKFSVGFLLCLVAFPKLKTKKEWGRYALSAVLFFVLSFAFGGALTTASGGVFGGKAPSIFIFLGFVVLSVIALILAKKLYKKRSLHAYMYDCRILYDKRVVAISGYMDSGNLAQKNGIPVCFLSPDIVYELFGAEILKEGGQVCDELEIATMSGGKKVPLYKAAIEIDGICQKKEVYFAPAKNMINREYRVLLNAGLLEDML